ncbi:MAG: hypothetical protein V4547_18905 [Bacteroidota bacterium]
MDISKSTYELLEPIIAAIDKTCTIQSVTTLSAGNYRLNVCNSLWATVGFNITIGIVVYKITAIVPNVSITVTGASAPIASSFQLYAPKFYHGTIEVTEEKLNAKVTGSLDSTLKLPAIWLHEPVDERNNRDLSNAIGRESECELFFLIDAKFAMWAQDDHYIQAIKPMRQLIMAFMTAVEKSGTVNYDLIEYDDIRDLPRFGRYTGQTGAKKTVFAQYEMSGVKQIIKIPFIRTDETCC